MSAVFLFRMILLGMLIGNYFCVTHHPYISHFWCYYRRDRNTST